METRFKKKHDIIIGAGVTGLSAGIASGFPVFESLSVPGGICSSYTLMPRENKRVFETSENDESYRFEFGGGHWIFGGDSSVKHFLRTKTPLAIYERRSSVFFQKFNHYVPYPIQNNLCFMGNDIASKALAEMMLPSGVIRTMKDWLLQCFGSTLCEKFFFPFHSLYTADLYDKIAPQDAYKSPVDIPKAIKGAFEVAEEVGYNVTFVYPREGLAVLAQKMADKCDVRYSKCVVEIDCRNHVVLFDDGTQIAYDNMISTLPLNKAVELSNISLEAIPDPYTSVLVLNIGAVRGKRCPDDHWLYISESESGFHRVGFYSNVDKSFLPRSSRERNDRVSIYVERAYPGGQKPTKDETAQYTKDVLMELQHWQFIEEVDVADPTWIEVAYTWSWPKSRWKETALKELEKHGIFQVGRYGRWSFQGIADSIRDGFYVGAALKK